MNYSTSEFCKLYNIGREALRHYERLGLLKPRINPDNQYRCYDEWDGSIIAEIRHYQALGFSLNEIRDILAKNDLPQIIASMETRVTLYQNKIQYYQLLCRKMEAELKLLKLIPNMLGHYSFRHIPDLVFFSDDTLIESFNSGKTNHIMQHLDFFTPCLRIDQAYSGDESRQNFSGWGLLATEEYAVYLGIQNTIAISASQALCTIIDAGEKGTVSKKLFQSFLNYVEQSTSRHDFTIYGVLLARTHDESGDYHRYLFTFTQI